MKTGHYLLITIGDNQEIAQLKEGFEREGATVTLTAPADANTVGYDGVIIPECTVEDAEDLRTIARAFDEEKKPVYASGKSKMALDDLMSKSVTVPGKKTGTLIEPDDSEWQKAPPLIPLELTRDELEEMLLWAEKAYEKAAEGKWQGLYKNIIEKINEAIDTSLEGEEE